MVDYLISLYTDQWVITHPAYLLAECSEPVDVLFIRDEVDRNDVGLLIANAGEASKLDLFQEVEALLSGQLVDEHWKSVFLRAICPF